MMHNPSNFDQRFEKLKQQAEELLKESPDFIDNIDPTHDLIHELQVYQAELEIQNEELRVSQRQLTTSRDRFSYLYHQAPVGYVTLNQKGVIQEANAKLAVMLGVQLSDLINKPFLNFIFPGDRDIYLGRYRAIFNSPEGKEIELRMESANNTVLHVLLEGRAVSQDHGDDTLLVTINDISHKVASEANLRLADQVIRTAHEAVIITNAKGNIIRVNPAFEEATGYSRQEVMGKNPRVLQSGRQSRIFYEQMWHEILHKGFWQGTVWNRKKSGEEYAERLSISAIRDSHREVTHYVGVFTDITEQLEMEEQLRQAQKMEAVGTLVGGIAHDFNNMLAGITGNLYLAKRGVEDRPEVLGRLEQIEELSAHAAELISYMLTFARKDLLILKDISLNKVSSLFVNSVARVTVPENVALNFDMVDENLIIHADATRIQQVLLNLLTNARDAVAEVEKPEITIKVNRFEPDELFCLKHRLKEGQSLALINVIDNGLGMDKERQKRVFEPFFTTKGVGKGTGLGLAMVYGAVESISGFIEIVSAPNEGTDFQIYLPLQDGEPVSQTQEKPLASPVERGGFVLLADDEETVRKVVSEALMDVGYQVLIAEDGEAALDLFVEHRDKLSVVILDVVMPKVGGKEAAEKIRCQNPDLPILFMSGYDQSEAIRLHEPLENSRVISKPFRIESLHQTVHELLGYTS